MKPKNALILFIIAVVLVVLLLLFENPFTSGRAKPIKGMAIEKVKVFAGVTRDSVAKIEISRFDGMSTSTLVKVNGVWCVNPEKKHVAEAKAVEAVFATLDSAREGEVVSRNPENLPKFGLNKMLGVHVGFFDSQGRLLEDVLIGRGGGRADFMSSYVLKAGSKDVIKVSAMLPFLFDRGGEEAWREHTIFDVAPEDIVALDIQGREGSYKLLKYASGDWELVEPKKQPVERTAVEQITRVFGRLRATGFEDNEAAEPLSEFGLDKPHVIVTAQMKDHSTTPVLFIGVESPKAKGQTFAKRPDRDQLYLIAQYQVDAFTTKPADFLKTPEEKEAAAKKAAAAQKAEKAKSPAKPSKSQPGKKAKTPGVTSKKAKEKKSSEQKPPSPAPSR
jgi:hypothetical protein